jgi:hypothetical protein
MRQPTDLLNLAHTKRSPRVDDSPILQRRTFSCGERSIGNEWSVRPGVSTNSIEQLRLPNQSRNIQPMVSELTAHVCTLPGIVCPHRAVAGDLPYRYPLLLLSEGTFARSPDSAREACHPLHEPNPHFGKRQTTHQYRHIWVPSSETHRSSHCPMQARLRGRGGWHPRLDVRVSDDCGTVTARPIRRGLNGSTQAREEGYARCGKGICRSRRRHHEQ